MKSKIVFGIITLLAIIAIVFSIFYYNVPRLKYTYNDYSASYSIDRFYGNSDSLVIPSTYKGYPVTQIKDNALADKNFSEVTFEFPSNISEIGRNAFKNNKNLKNIVIPKSVVTTKMFAFSGCSSLETVSFEDDSQFLYLGGSTFYECSKLQNIELPSSIKVIGSYSFSYCLELENVSFPSSILTIENNVFYGSKKLSEVSYYSSTDVSDLFLETLDNVTVIIK